MKRKSEPQSLLAKRTLASLIIFVAVPVACQDGNRSSNSGVTTASNQTASQKTAVDSANPNDGPVDSSGEKDATKPSIHIIEVPSKGAGEVALETIAGTVSGVKVKECKVVIFAHTNTWYVQPYIDSSDTDIRDDNTWRTETHLGSEYAALLVKASYKPPATTGKLPEIGGLVLAIDRVNSRN